MSSTEYQRRRQQLMKLMTPGSIAVLPASRIQNPQPRHRTSVPPEQRLLLPDRLRGAQRGAGACAGSRTRRGDSVLPGARSRPRTMDRRADGSGPRVADARRGRWFPDHRSGRHPARAARRPGTRSTPTSANIRNSIATSSAGSKVSARDRYTVRCRRASSSCCRICCTICGCTNRRTN